jgi:protein TonB
MNDFDSSISRRTKIIEALLWSGAALVTLGAHSGAVAWMLRADPVVAVDSSPPAAIMVEVAAAPESMQTEKDEVTPDLTSANESVSQNEQKQQDPPQERVVEQVTEPEEVKPAENEKDRSVVLEKAEVQLPTEQPKSEKKPKEKSPREKKPRPRQQQASTNSNTMHQAEIQARRSDRMAAAETVSGVSSMSPASWQALLMAHLERYKRYPSDARPRGERGIASVYFTIDGAGNVLSAKLVRSSGFSALDQEVLSAVRRASPVPAPPPGANRGITAPMRFNLD